MPITGRGPASEGGNISEPIVKGSIVLSGFAGTYLFPPGVARLKSQYDTQQPRMGFLCPQRTCFFHISRYLRR